MSEVQDTCQEMMKLAKCTLRMISHFAKMMVGKVTIPSMEIPRPKVGYKRIWRESERSFPTKANSPKKRKNLKGT
jgi:hypothetical protein